MSQNRQELAEKKNTKELKKKIEDKRKELELLEKFHEIRNNATSAKREILDYLFFKMRHNFKVYPHDDTNKLCFAGEGFLNYGICIYVFEDGFIEVHSKHNQLFRMFEPENYDSFENAYIKALETADRLESNYAF
ncbi:hypothetical protein U8V72_23090 [Priestia filamentosa]|uniref:hypothetical protein n=1 Tax=Priestia filamentosa TaxID=1402861 RepID=UPI00058906CA